MRLLAVAIVGWTLFVCLSFWHFVIEPMHVQLNGLTNVVQQLARQRPVPLPPTEAPN